MIVKKYPRKKLAFFVLPLKFFISHRLPIALSAKKKGYEVHIISMPSKERRFIESQGFIFHELEIKRKNTNPIQEIRSILHLYKLYKSINPAIVHHITIKPVLYGTLLARLAKVNAVVNAFSGLGYIFTASGIKAAIMRNVIKLAYRLILRHPKLLTIIQNHDDMEYLISKSIIRKNETILIKGSGVDLNKYTMTPEPNDIPIVILPARLLKDKGVLEFVEAAAILKKQNFNVHMALVGDIDLGNPSSISEQNLENWVKNKIISHWGFCSNMPETLAKANIICLPSYREGMPKSLIEACASGRAIITTDVPGCREMIDISNPNGILVPPRDPKSLAKAIEELVNNPRKRQQMAINGRKMAEKEFSIDLVIQKTMNIYSRLLD